MELAMERSLFETVLYFPQMASLEDKKLYRLWRKAPSLSLVTAWTGLRCESPYPESHLTRTRNTDEYPEPMNLESV
jgi:hypothetical protein